MLGRRDYTSAELAKKLRERGYAADVIDPLITELCAAGALNDRRVAEAHVRTSAGVKGRGRVRVARELQARGVPATVVDDVVGAMDPEAEASAIRRILARKRYPARPTRTDRQRMYLHLLRRGFPTDAIRHALGRGAGEGHDPADE